MLSSILLMLLAACAAGGSPSTPSLGPTGSSDAGTTPVAPTASTPSQTPGTSEPAGSGTETSGEREDLTLLPTKSPGGQMLTLTGVPTAGVEARCWLLDGYLLLDVPAELIGTGRPITVTGRVEQDLMTTCQQGIPLRVESAEAA
jgi:hypothetical protein